MKGKEREERNEEGTAGYQAKRGKHEYPPDA